MVRLAFVVLNWFFLFDKIHSHQISFTLAHILNMYADVHKSVLINFSGEDAIEKNEQLDILKEVLHLYSYQLPIIIRNGQQKNRVHQSFYNVILIGSLPSFKKICQSFNAFEYDSTGMYTVVYQHVLRNGSELVEGVFNCLRRKQIFNVLFIAPSTFNQIEVYTYRPFRNKDCANVNPELVMVSKDGKAESQDRSLFSNKFNNMNLCQLKVGTYPLEPFTIPKNDHDGNTFYDGTEVRIVQTVAKMHNFTVQFIYPENNMRWGFIEPQNSTGLMGLIQDELVDVGFGSVGISAQRSFYLKAGMSHFISKFVIAIPPGRNFTSLEKLFKPFTLNAWMLLSIAVCMGMILMKLRFGKQNLKYSKLPWIELLPNPMLNGWLTFLGNPMVKFPQNWMARSVITSWLFLGLVVRTSYQSATYRYLHHGQQTKPVRTFLDVEAAGLYFYMFDVTQRFFELFPDVLKRYIQVKRDCCHYKLEYILFQS